MKRNFALLLLTLISLWSFGQHVITGTITDPDTKESIPGATVIIKGTQRGTASDMDGKYSIEAEKGETLLFSFIGYDPQEITVSDEETINIELVMNSLDLDEYVVVGYGIQKKSDVTGALSKIGKDAFEETHSQSIAQIMQGRASGVTVTSTSGSPGKSPDINIRGVSSINGTPPLWVVDGVPISGTINALDIESMEILKDASAAAIYGTKGAGGVILVTTKKGKKGEMKLNYENRFNFSQFPKYLELSTAKDWARLRIEATENAGVPVPESLRGTFGEGTDWQKEITNQGAFSNSHFISASGGSEKINYYMSFNHSNEQGIVQKSSAVSNSFRINASAQIKDWLKVGENLSIGRDNIRAINEEDEWNAVLIEAIAIDPITRPRKDDGSWEGTQYNSVANPVAHLDRTNGENKNFNMAGDVYAEISFLKDFTWVSKFGYNQIYDNYYDWTPSFFVKVGEENDQTSVSRDYYEQQDLVFSSYLTWMKSFNKHHITAMAGYEGEQNKSEWFGTSATDLISENADNIFIDNASGNLAASSYGLAADVKLRSFFGRLNYNFAGKYFLTANIRNQGSSKFGENHRYGNFPSVSAGWKISDEAFMDNVSWIDNLKIRAGFGITGNDQSLNPYMFYGTTATGNNYVVNGQIVSGVAMLAIPNPDLHWEEKSATNIGIDFSAFSDRLTLSSDFFINTTKDMILQVDLPGHVGAEQPPFQNVATMKNTGYEFNIGYKNKVSEFGYDFNLTFSQVKNEVTDLGSAASINEAPFMQLGRISRTETGQPMANFYGYVTEGLFQNQAEVDAYVKPDGSPIQPYASPGDIRYKADSDGNLVNEVIGSPFPDFTAGLNMRFKYKSFSLIAFFYGVYGNEIFNTNKFFTHNSSVRYNVSPDLKDRWLMEGDTDDPNLARLNLNDANNGFRSDRFIEDGSYLRLKNIQLEYTLPKRWVNAISIAYAKVFVGSDNLFTLTKFTGYDPEVGIYLDNPLDRGISRATYPNPKTFYFGLSIQL